MTECERCKTVRNEDSDTIDAIATIWILIGVAILLITILFFMIGEYNLGAPTNIGVLGFAGFLGVIFIFVGINFAPSSYCR